MRSVCECCLSSGRVLSPLSPPFRRLMCTLLPQQSSIEEVCWECTAVLQKTLQLQARAERAHKWLEWANVQDDSQVYNAVPSLTSLGVKIKTEINCLTSDCEESYFCTGGPIKRELVEDNFIEVIPDILSVEEEIDSKAGLTLETSRSLHQPKENVDVKSFFNKMEGKVKRKKNVKKNRENKKENILEHTKRKETRTLCMDLLEGKDYVLKLTDCGKSEIEESPHHRCDYCNKIFASKHRLVNHLKRFEGQCTQKQGNSRVKEKELYQCKDCNSKFAYRCHLIEHSRTHTGEKPHECNRCGKRYTQTASLNRHLRTHNEDRRFVCTYCGQRFVERRTLTDHYNIHTGQRPYLCSECGKSFTQKGALRTHTKTHSVVG